MPPSSEVAGPAEGDRAESGRDELESLRERLLGVEDRASVKSWFPRLRETVARLEKSEAELRSLNEDLESQVETRTEELRRANAELARNNARLQAALDELEATREARLRGERLATKVALVGRVAHELNTPLGALLSSAASLGALLERVAGFLAELEPDYSAGEAGAFRDLVAHAARRILELPLAVPDLAYRRRVRAELERRAIGPELVDEADLAELGLEPGSPLFELALDRPRALRAAALAQSALSAAAIAKSSGEKAATAVRELQESVKTTL